jgi:mRNA-degrading endonuclease toxin of MazEF toxin-antitoxin module
VLLARNEAYSVLTWIAVAPLTTSIRDIATFVELTPREDGVLRRCAINLDGIQAVKRDWLDSLVVRLRQEKLEEVDKAIHLALGLRG